MTFDMASSENDYLAEQATNRKSELASEESQSGKPPLELLETDDDFVYIHGPRFWFICVA